MATISKIKDQYRIRYLVHLPDGAILDRSRRLDKKGLARELKAIAEIMEARTRRQEYGPHDIAMWRREGLLSVNDAVALKIRQGGEKTVSQAVAEYKSHIDCSWKEKEEKIRRADRISQILGEETPIDAIRHSDGEALKASLRQSLKAVTVNKYLQVAKQIFTLQLAEGSIVHHPFGVLKGVNVPQKEKIDHTTLSHTQISIVLQEAMENDRKDPKNIGNPPALGGQLTLFLLMFFGCGLRRKEALLVRLKDINWQDRSLHLRKEITKNGKERTIGLGGRLFKVLEERKGGKGLILPTYHETSVTRAITRHFARCGFAGMRLHDTRHTYTTRLLDLGINRHDAMERTGHSNSKMLDHYTHPEFGEVYEDDFDFMKVAGAEKPDRQEPVKESKTHLRLVK